MSEKCVKKIHMIPLDVTNPASIENSVKLVEEFLPERNGLNLLINNAGMHLEKVATFPTCTQEGLLEHFKVNTVGPILVTQVNFQSTLLLAQIRSVIGILSSTGKSWHFQ